MRYVPVDRVLFRQYRDRDRHQVRELHEAALKATNAFAKRGPWDKDLDDVWGSYINNNGDFLVGEIAEQQVVAMGAYRQLSPRIAELKRMRVRPDLQGQGLGRRLLSLLEDRIRTAGYTTIQLDTTVNQLAARVLYERSGYVEIRREVEGWPLETIFYAKTL
ncbi:MAG: family N-acetyltransferase [Frankiales bacterium]|nr:family N-acetyltransferase [Frankiales bacterium]